MTEPEELEALPAEEERALAKALAAAVRPQPIAERRHEEILASVGLPALDAPASEEELRAAAAFAKALDSREGDDPEVRLARALALAARPSDTGPSSARAHERALERSGLRARTGGRLLIVSFGVGGAALAAAAAVALFVGLARQPPGAPDLVRSRSLAPLFEAGASELGASARLDRIVSARARDLRANRYAAWGVR